MMLMIGAPEPKFQTVAARYADPEADPDAEAEPEA
jgi:hypothetical protein